MSELTSKLPLDAQYIIRRVKMTRFFVNELLYTPDPNKLVGTDMSPVFGFNVEKNFVNLTITFFIFYIDSPSKERLAEITLDNVFEVANLNKFISNNIANIPDPLLYEIINMSVSHARALFSANLAGTPYQNVIIPITNAQSVIEHFFPANSNQNIRTQKEEEINESKAHPSKKVKPTGLKK